MHSGVAENPRFVHLASIVNISSQTMPKRETSSEIDEAAARWAARLDRAPLSHDEDAALEAWLSADIRRRGAFAKAHAVMAHTDRARALGSGSVDVPSAPPHRRRALLLGASALAAGLAGVFVASEIVLRQTAELKTAKGEVRHVPLSDGSSVTLNTDTVLRVNFSPATRDVELVAGEALFNVAKDKQRPFIVTAGDTRVRAVGTSFTVRCQKDLSVRVVVSEGVVEVSKPGQPRPVRVAANVVAVTAASAGVAVPLAASVAPVRTQTLGPNEVVRGLAWREGMLSFDGETLAEAAAEFDRYSTTRIVIDDPELGHETVTGLFSASDPQGFAKAVAISFNGQVKVKGDQVHLSR